MTYIKTYNELIEEFKLFSDAHFQLKDFGNGPTSDIGVSRKMDFPYLWITHRTPSSITVGNKIQIPDMVLTFIVVDQINNQDNYEDTNGVDSDNQQEILSDTLQIVQDLINYISQNLGSRGVSLLENTVNIEPTYDDTDDRVTGWVIDLTLRLKHLNCITPMADVVYPSGTTPTYITPSPYLTCDTLENCSIIQQLLNSTGGSLGVDSIYTQTIPKTLTGDTLSTDTEFSLISGLSGVTGDLSSNYGVGDLTISGNTLSVGDRYYVRMDVESDGVFLSPILKTKLINNTDTEVISLFQDNTVPFVTNSKFVYESTLTVRSIGTSGNAEIFVSSNIYGSSFSDFDTQHFFLIDNVTQNTTFDTTVDNHLDFTFEYNDFNLGSTITNNGISVQKISGGETLTCDTLSGCSTIQTIENDIDNLYLTKNSRLYTQTSDSTPITNTTTESSLIGTGLGSLSIPSNVFQVGDTFRVVMGGRLTNGNNEDLTLRVKSGSVILADSGLQSLTTHSDDTFKIEIDFTIRNTGTTGVGNIITLGTFQTIKKNSSEILGFEFTDQNNTTFDTTVPNTLDITLEWDNALVGNSIYSQIFTLQKTY